MRFGPKLFPEGNVWFINVGSTCPAWKLSPFRDWGIRERVGEAGILQEEEEE